MTGRHDPEGARRGMADFGPSPGARRYRPQDSPGLRLLTRYHWLVATINGRPTPTPERATAPQKWMAAALREGAA